MKEKTFILRVKDMRRLVRDFIVPGVRTEMYYQLREMKDRIKKLEEKIK